jgi:phosphohistidine swiveling domain-containing protein
MAINNKRISVAELDFDAIKLNIKNYLKGQTEFSDYDFEGSAMSVLIDLLAYNTHYNSIYTNLAVNEMFLDSASKRSSVVSLAKMLGYTPVSAKCATSTVNISISSPTSNPAVVTLPANQPFIASLDGKTYTFYNREAITVSANTNGIYQFLGVTLVEGTPLKFKYSYTDGQRILIPNSNVDLSTLAVRIQETATTDEYVVFSKVEDLVIANESTNVYFIKEIDNGLYELNFGDGIVGTALSSGNVITLDYYVSSLEAANNIKAFTYGGVTLLGSNLSVVTVTESTGGAASEAISSIKFNAPRTYAAQNRAVTPEDYKVLVRSILPEAQTVQVWGGENNIPKIYGKTFICVKPTTSTKLTTLQKDYLTSSLLKRNVVSITPEIVDPEYLNISINCTVYYNDRNTTKTPSQLTTIVKNAIINYDEDNLQKFDGLLRFSKLSSLIDSSDTSITNNITKLTITRRITPKYNLNSEYIINLINPISQEGNKLGEVFKSTAFLIPNSTNSHYLDDDENGNIRLFYYDTNYSKIIVNATIGTISYSTGLINIKNLNIASLADDSFEITVKPASYDVVSALNQIVQIDSEFLTVNVIADKSASGNLEAGQNYVFTSIR